MFSSREYLAHKTPSGALNRLEFLQQLVTEFQTSQDQEAQEQVLANLANFAYDPINYEYMRQLNIIDLFLDMLTEPNETLVEFGLGGLCNLALDKMNKQHILANDGVQQIVHCLSSTNEEVILSAVTTLMFLVTPASKPEITSPHVLMCMERFTKSSSKRLSNLAHVFLQHYCTEEQRLQAKKVFESAQDVDQIPAADDIPLPSGPPPPDPPTQEHAEASPSDPIPVTTSPT